MWRLVCCSAWLLLCAPAFAEGYDDPAVAICEFDYFNGKSPPEGYMRTNAEVAGDAASVSYEMATLNIRPRPGEFSCTYRLTDRGFLLHGPMSPEAAACLENLPRLQEEIKKHKVGSTIRFNLQGEINQCQRDVRPIQDKEAHRATYMARLVAAGVYPIIPADTSLSSRD